MKPLFLSSSLTVFILSTIATSRCLADGKLVPVMGPPTPANDPAAQLYQQAPSPQGSYLTVHLETARIYNHSSIFTLFLTENPTDVISAQVTGSMASTPFNQTLAAQPSVVPSHTKATVDVGFSADLISQMPTTYDSLAVDLAAHSLKSEDQITGAIPGLLSSVGSFTPIGAGTSAAISGAMGALTTVFKFLGDAHLDTTIGQMHFELPSFGANYIPAGWYAFFMAQDASEYNRYVAPNVRLTWDQNHKLLSASDDAGHDIPITAVSYMILHITYQSRLAANGLDLISHFSQSKTLHPWASHFEQIYLTFDPSSYVALSEPDRASKIDGLLLPGRTMALDDKLITSAEYVALDRDFRTALGNEIASYNTHRNSAAVALSPASLQQVQSTLMNSRLSNSQALSHFVGANSADVQLRSKFTAALSAESAMAAH